MLHINIGVTALQASQSGLATIANNIANASTPGFHRQRTELAERAGTNGIGQLIGGGVVVTGVTRLQDVTTETALIHNQYLPLAYAAPTPQL